MDGSSWRFSEPSTYANANLVPTARKPSPEGQLKICTDTPEVNRFREKWPVRTQNSENGVVRGQQVETKNPTERGARRGYRPVREWFCQCYWRGLGGFELSIPKCPSAALQSITYKFAKAYFPSGFQNRLKKQPRQSGPVVHRFYSPPSPSPGLRARCQRMFVIILGGDGNANCRYRFARRIKYGSQYNG
jgi:hypothetical protein